MTTNIAEYFFMFATLGEMVLKDVLAECQEQAWVPLVVIRPHAEKSPVLIPCFNTRENAIKFGKRNLPKSQLFGTAVFPEADVQRLTQQWVTEKGWEFAPMDHPRLINNIGRLDVEVYEPEEKPDVFGLWGKHCKRSGIISYSL